MRGRRLPLVKQPSEGGSSIFLIRIFLMNLPSLLWSCSRHSTGSSCIGSSSFTRFTLGESPPSSTSKFWRYSSSRWHQEVRREVRGEREGQPQFGGKIGRLQSLDPRSQIGIVPAVRPARRGRPGSVQSCGSRSVPC